MWLIWVGVCAGILTGIVGIYQHRKIKRLEQITRSHRIVLND